MNKSVKLRLTGRQFAALHSHLFSRDGSETIAIAFCGVGELREEEVLHQTICVNKIIPISYSLYFERTPISGSRKTEFLSEILKEAEEKKQVILKIRSNPTDAASFSGFDDKDDIEFFKGVHGWLDNGNTYLSAIIMPDGCIIARTVSNNGSFGEVSLISVAGDDIRIWYNDENQQNSVPEYAIRTVQSFGKGTTELLSKLTIGVVGASGTGSPTIEMLYRLGAGKLILVDPDIVEEKNIGRIYNSTMDAAAEGREKVNVISDAIKRSGLPTKVVPLPMDIFNPQVIRILAQCDILFGCMDSIDGRDLLNRVSSFYSIPYFDLGVCLDADGHGSVKQVCGKVNYLQPDGSSLFSRGVYTEEMLRSSSLRRTNPEEYENQVKSKYIKGIQEDRPAVISVNTLIASLAVNDFLARIHPYRDDPNSEFSSLGISLSQSRLILEEEGESCNIFAKFTGRGDISPLLNMPILSEMR